MTWDDVPANLRTKYLRAGAMKVARLARLHDRLRLDPADGEALRALLRCFHGLAGWGGGVDGLAIVAIAGQLGEHDCAALLGGAIVPEPRHLDQIKTLIYLLRRELRQQRKALAAAAAAAAVAQAAGSAAWERVEEVAGLPRATVDTTSPVATSRAPSSPGAGGSLAASLSAAGSLPGAVPMTAVSVSAAVPAALAMPSAAAITSTLAAGAASPAALAEAAALLSGAAAAAAAVGVDLRPAAWGARSFRPAPAARWGPATSATAAASAPWATSAAAATAAAAPAAAYKALLVGMEPQEAELLQGFLAPYGIGLEVVETSYEAGRILAAGLPDALITAAELADGTGYVLADYLRGLPGGQRPVVALLGAPGRKRDAAELVRCGIDIFIAGPANPAALGGCLAQRLALSAAAGTPRLVCLAEDAARALEAGELLTDAGYLVRLCNDPRRLPRLTLSFDAELVLMDQPQPDGTASDLLRRLRQDPRSAIVPVVLLARPGEPLPAAPSLIGADLAQSCDRVALLGAIAHRLERSRALRQLFAA